MSQLKINEEQPVQKKLTTWQVLREKFPASEYVLIEEVSDASGFSRSRSLDFMIVNLWQSRGLSVTGIERKSNRGDWQKELKNPAKQENHFKYCDYFFLLTDKEGVAKIEEIPETWGWYHINDKGVLKTLKQAPKLNPLPIERSLMCAMMRRAADKTKYVHVDALEDSIQKKAESIHQHKNYELEREAAAYKSLKEKVDIFESVSGIQIKHSYAPDLPKIAEVVKMIISSGIEDHKKRLLRMQEQLQSVQNTISLNLSNAEKFTEPVLGKIIQQITIKD